MSKAILEIKFRKSRVESLEKSMSMGTIVTISEIYFHIFPKFPKILPSENFPLYGNNNIIQSLSNKAISLFIGIQIYIL